MNHSRKWAEQILDAEYPRETLLLRIANSLDEVAGRCADIAAAYECMRSEKKISDAIRREFQLPG